VGQLVARMPVLLLFERAHAEDEPRIGAARAAVDLHHAFGQLDRFVDVAVGEHGIERELQELAVARIGFERRTVEGRSRGGVASGARVPRRKIISRNAGYVWIARRRRNRLGSLGRKKAGQTREDSGPGRHGHGSNKRRTSHGRFSPMGWSGGRTRMRAAGQTDNDRFIRAPQAGKLAPSKSRASPPDRGSLAAALWRG
jgi:hypothetical protein